MCGKDDFEEGENRMIEIESDEDLKGEQILTIISALSPWLGTKLRAIDLTQMARKLQEVIATEEIFRD